MLENLPNLLGALTHGVHVIGVDAGDRRNAFTAAWVMQASFDPPLLVVSVNPAHSSYGLIDSAKRFTVNVLSREQLAVAAHFGQPAAADKLGGYDWRSSPYQGVIIDAAVAWIDCRVVGDFPAGDHRLVVGEVIDGAVLRPDAVPLIYRDTGNLDGSAELYPEGE